MGFKDFHLTVTVSQSVKKHRVGHGNPIIKSSWPVYQVESLVRTRGTGDDVEVEVRWVGYSDLTWEPLASVAHLTTLIATLT